MLLMLFNPDLQVQYELGANLTQLDTFKPYISPPPPNDNIHFFLKLLFTQCSSVPGL